jgi:hypothetical protein
MLPMTAAAAVPALPALTWDRCPNPAQIDRLVLEFCELEAKVDRAYAVAQQLDEPLEKFRERLILVAEEFGQPHAQKSKLLVGAASEIVATFGSMRTIDAAAVAQFREALQKAGRIRILRQFFEECTTWRLIDGADGLIRRQQMSDHLQALFSRCFVEKAKAPVLKVRLK